MNEAETRAEHIDPALAAAGWGVVDGSRIRREYPITLGRIEGHGRRGKSLTADYVLEYRNTKLATVEAKAWDQVLTEGVGQAKDYAAKLALRWAYSTNGQRIYQIDMGENGHGRYGIAVNDGISESHKSHASHQSYSLEREVLQYPTPDELWGMTFAEKNAWRDRFAAVPFEDRGGYFQGRYYQDIAIERVLESIAAGKDRILLTLATGTGKTFVAFQIAWKLFHARWSRAIDNGQLTIDSEAHSPLSIVNSPLRRPRILFLADRTILEQSESRCQLQDGATCRMSREYQKWTCLATGLCFHGSPGGAGKREGALGAGDRVVASPCAISYAARTGLGSLPKSRTGSTLRVRSCIDTFLTGRSLS